MLVYRYSGTLDGLLCVIFDSYSNRRKPDYIMTDREEAQLPLLAETVVVEDNEEQAQRVEAGLIRAGGVEILRHLLYGFASSEPEKALVVYRWIVCVFHYGSDVDSMYAHPDVLAFQRMESRVTYEIHRMCGFIRFRELQGGMLYAEFAPDHPITAFLMPHFVSRYPEEVFLIHDVSRHIYGLYNGKEWKIAESDETLPLVFSDAETLFSKLWKQYYQTVSIASRRNTRLRNGWMPRRYWHYLVEFVN